MSSLSWHSSTGCSTTGIGFYATYGTVAELTSMEVIAVLVTYLHNFHSCYHSIFVLERCLPIFPSIDKFSDKFCPWLSLWILTKVSGIEWNQGQNLAHILCNLLKAMQGVGLETGIKNLMVPQFLPLFSILNLWFLTNPWKSILRWKNNILVTELQCSTENSSRVNYLLVSDASSC